MTMQAQKRPAPVAPPGASTLPAGGWLAIIAGALMVFGSFLPWVTEHTFLVTVSRNAFELGSDSGFSIDGVICVALGIVTAVIGIARLTRSAMPRLMQGSPIITGIAAALLVANRAPSINDLAREINSSSNGLATASIGYGLWTVAVGAAVAIVAGLTLPRRR